MTEKQERNAALKAAKNVAIDLRVMLEDARHNVAEFEKYVNSWDEEIRLVKELPDENDPRALTERFVISRAFEQLEDITHIHRGSTAHMHYRSARDHLILLAKTAP